MNILITGIHGFVGSNLVESLTTNHTIYGLDIIAPYKAGVVKTFSWHELEKLPLIDAVIHLAGKAHDTKNTSSAQSYFDINLGLTQKIFDYFLQSDAHKFIFFSSVKAVADTVSGDFLTEEDPPDPKTPYGQSKLAAEQYILSQKLPANKKVYILRPVMIHGPGNKGNMNLLYKIVRIGIPWPLGSFNNQRSFLSINNLVFVLSNIIEKDIPPGIYQLSDDEAVSTNALIQLISKSLHRRTFILHIPQKIIRFLAKAGDVMHLPLNSERLKKLTESYVVLNHKIKKAIGIDALPVQAKEGFQLTFNSFNKNDT